LPAAGSRVVASLSCVCGSPAESRLRLIIAARKKGVVVVRSSRVGNGLVMRSSKQRDDELGYVVSDSLSPQKARILVMLALLRANDVARIQNLFYEY